MGQGKKGRLSKREKLIQWIKQEPKLNLVGIKRFGSYLTMLMLESTTRHDYNYLVVATSKSIDAAEGMLREEWLNRLEIVRIYGDADHKLWSRVELGIELGDIKIEPDKENNSGPA